MSYNPQLNLHLSQGEIFLDKSKNNNYSDVAKKQYQNKLFDVFSKIKSSIVDNLDQTVIFEKQEHLNFIFRSLEFLKDSTLNSIPFEVVSCLNMAMNDWVDGNDYIIVTSLNNNVHAYSYDPSLAFEDLLYKSIEANYGVVFEKKLVQINLPLILSRDYFSSVVLYHELGHFVDLRYGISQKIALFLLGQSQSEWDKYNKYLPIPQNVQYQSVLESHIAEYFCDIFASQYIGTTSNLYLKYLTKNSSSVSYTHPSTTNRIQAVDDFISNTSNPIVDKIKEYTLQISNRELKTRFTNLTSEDFYNFIPVEANSAEDVHGIFQYAWNIWLNGTDDFVNKSKVKSGLSSDRVYKILNNLIEKSIGNYFICLDWKSTI
ncbi:hypothetical protein [Mucilaginibacter lacusdianchii]|uniref:hypothetical protein n=1 Tax=Mucilaginibacter lacusdianchii TaxID=2684211 RepID=UPI00131DED79|nr:hypothetical protein [Mucilaginibacter sp. JXJ CY 39]